MKKQLSKLQVRQLKVLNDTKEYYSKDTSRRAAIKVYDEDTCEYLTNDGRRCALGRLVTKAKAQELARIAGGVADVFDELPKSVANLTEFFLFDLQNFHDNKRNWNKAGITKRGLSKYKLIKNNIIKGQYN